MSPMRGSKSCDCSAWRREGTGGSYISLYASAYKNLNEGYKEYGARHMTMVPNGAQWQNKRQWEKVKQEGPPEHQQTLCLLKGD